MSLATIEAQRPQLTAGGRVEAIIPHSMDEAYRLAKAVCMAGMAPRGMDTPEKAMIAIMRGMEVGLTPFQALDKIAVVNGRPTIWGDGAMALVRGSGLCEWVMETIEGEGDKRVAICESKRRGDPKPIKRTFAVSDAKKAGLWGKQGPWTQYPDRMLGMRARAFCLRDGYADVLGGLYLKEEFDGVEGRATPAAIPTPPVPPAPPSLVRAQLEASVQEIGFNWDAYRAALSEIKTIEDADAIWREKVEGSVVKLTEEETEEAQRILNEATSPLWESVHVSAD